MLEFLCVRYTYVYQKKEEKRREKRSKKKKKLLPVCDCVEKATFVSTISIEKEKHGPKVKIHAVWVPKTKFHRFLFKLA